MLPAFQLKALVVRGPVTSGDKLSINLDQVAIAEDEVRDALLCLRDFVEPALYSA